MEEIELYELLPIMMEELGKKSVTVYELNMWTRKYWEEHPDVHICSTRVDIGHAHGCGYIWWEIRDEGSDILHWQESIRCPFTNTKISKYPNTVHYEKTKQILDAIKIDVQHVLNCVDLDEEQRKIRENIIYLYGLRN